MLVDLSVTIMQLTVSVAIMQLEVSAAHVQVTVSAASMQMAIFTVIRQMGDSVAIMQVVFSAMHYAHDCLHGNYAGDYPPSFFEGIPLPFWVPLLSKANIKSYLLFLRAIQIGACKL